MKGIPLMADETEYVPLMQLLVRQVMRKFYEPHHCVIMDILLENLLLKESELYASMHMLGKEFNRLITKLREDKLIRQESKIETTQHGTQLHSQCYFIDFKEIKDIIKYKIFKMGNIITKRKEKDISDVNISYRCSSCEAVYSILEVQSFLKNFKFICPDCEIPLEENKDENIFELHTLMMDDLKDIIDLLKKADQFDIPTMDYFQVLNMKKRHEERQKTIQTEILKEIKPIESEKTGIESFAADEPTNDEHITFFSSTENIKRQKIEIVSEPEQLSETKIMVKVNGIEKEFAQITEDDQENMTEQEYEDYFDIYSRVHQ